MSRNFKFYAKIWTVLVVLFNVIVFVTPNEMAGMSKFGGAFWSGYICIMIAFLGQLGVSYLALQEVNIQKLFYNISLIRVSWTGLILTIVAGTICMIIPDLPIWAGIIICFIVLAFTAIAVVKAQFASEEISKIDEKIKGQTLFLKSITADAEILMSQTSDVELKKLCKQVYEALRYSDPMSSDALASLESQIIIKFDEFRGATGVGDIVLVEKVSNELIALINDRNNKCKLVK